MTAPYATLVVSHPDAPDLPIRILSGTVASILWGARSVTITITPDTADAPHEAEALDAIEAEPALPVLSNLL